MKKRLFFLSVVFMFFVHTQAQITLTQSNTDFTIGTITAISADTTGIFIPTGGVNKQWNYANMVQNGISSYGYVTPTNSNFSTATFADTNGSSPIIPNKYYYYDSYYQTSSNGANTMGYVIKDQRYGIGNLTMNPNDSIIFPEQAYTYTSSSYILPFPTSMSTSWNTNLRSVTNFILTITGYSINQAPCQKVTNTVRLDTVVGWGTMRVPTASGPSMFYDVLMVKRIIVQTDSFYMAGAVAPSALLTAFGLSQGQTTVNNRYLFWRENARYALMLVNFGSDNFTKASSIYYDGTVTPSGITEINKNTGIHIYPNPNNGNFSIETDQQINEPFELDVYNIFGQKVYSKKIITSDFSSQQIHLDNLDSGTYFVSIVSDNKRLTSKLLIR